MPAVKKSVRAKSRVSMDPAPMPPPTPEPTPEPSPMPTPPPGPMQLSMRDRHGETTLAFLMLITLVVLVAVSTGLSLYNAIELSRLRDAYAAKWGPVGMMGADDADAAPAAAPAPSGMMPTVNGTWGASADVNVPQNW